MSVRRARGISTGSYEASVVFDEMLTREEVTAASLWWSPTADGKVFYTDSSKSWFIRWHTTMVASTDLRQTYQPVKQEVVFREGSGAWLRVRFVPLAPLGYTMRVNLVEELGDALQKFDSTVEGSYSRIRRMIRGADPVFCQSAHEACAGVIETIFRTWPQLADCCVRNNVTASLLATNSAIHKDCSSWTQSLIYPFVAGLDSGYVNITDGTEQMLCLKGNYDAMDNRPEISRASRGGAMIIRGSAGKQAVSNLGDIVNWYRNNEPHRTQSFVLGIKVLASRLARRSLVQRDDSFLDVMFWPTSDSERLRLGDCQGRCEPDDDTTNTYTYANREKFVAS